MQRRILRELNHVMGYRGMVAYPLGTGGRAAGFARFRPFEPSGCRTIPGLPERPLLIPGKEDVSLWKGPRERPPQPGQLTRTWNIQPRINQIEPIFPQEKILNPCPRVNNREPARRNFLARKGLNPV